MSAPAGDLRQCATNAPPARGASAAAALQPAAPAVPAAPDELDALLRYGPGLRALAVRLVGVDDADDLLQETWIRALRRPPNTDRPVWPWLVRVLRNGAFNMRRARRTREEHEAVAAAGRADQDDSRPAWQQAELDAAAQLLREVEALPDPQRSVVTGCYLVGQTSAQVGQALSLPASTVRWHLRSAVGTLRVRLRVADQGRDPSGWVAALVPLIRMPDGAALVPPAGGLPGRVSGIRPGRGSLAARPDRAWAPVAGWGAAVGGLALLGVVGAVALGGRSSGAATGVDQALGSADDVRRSAPLASGRALGAGAPEFVSQELRARVSSGGGLRTGGESAVGRTAAGAAATGVLAQVVRVALVDAAGLPWPGATLTLERAPTLARQLSRAAEPAAVVAEASADGSGVAVLTLAGPLAGPGALFAGEADLYRLCARAPGAATVTAHLPGFIGLDLDLGTLQLEPEVPVTGVVVDPAGVPVAGALVTAVPALAAPPAVSSFADEVDAPLDLLGVRAVSDHLGRFELRGLAARAARFDAAAPDGRRAARSLDAAALAEGGPFALTLSGAPVAVERLRLHVRDERGAAVPGARVAVQRGRLRARELDAAADGSLDEVLAHFEGDPREAVTVHAWDPEGRFAVGTLTGVALDGVPRTLTLTAAAPLTVDVRGPGGEAVDGFDWRLVLAGGRFARAGRVPAGPLAPGSQAALPLPAEDDPLGPVTLAVAAPGFEPTTVPLGAGATLQVELQREAVLTGRVTAGGAPVAGARVVVALPRSPRLAVGDTTRLRRSLGPRVAVSAPDGTFSVPRPAGAEVTVTVAAPPGHPACAPVVRRLGRGAPAALDVELAPGSTLLAELRLPHAGLARGGAVLSAGEVALIAEDAAGTQRRVPLVEGRLPAFWEASLEGLAAGPWSVAAWRIDPTTQLPLEPVSRSYPVELRAGYVALLRLAGEGQM